MLGLMETAVSAALPGNLVLPSIVGLAQPRQRLTVTSGRWSGTTPSYRYQWLRCRAADTVCTKLAGATSNSYTVAPSDKGWAIEASVTAADARGKATATSAPTVIIR
jgi:hypothetical protein